MVTLTVLAFCVNDWNATGDVNDSEDCNKDGVVAAVGCDCC